jgi:hypothetical protein
LDKAVGRIFCGRKVIRMLNIRSVRILSVLAGSLVLCLTLGRCGPLAPSIPKAETSSQHASVVIDSNSNSLGLLSNGCSLIILPSTTDLPADASVLSEDEVADFRDLGGVSLTLGSGTVVSAIAVIKIKGTEEDIGLMGLDKLQASFTPKASSSWLFSIKQESSSAAWEILKVNLLQVGLIINEGEIGILHQQKLKAPALSTPGPK